ncbi:hypothetical protein niasHT_036516 [Heterodera trifolii]|uniref:Uncharacterized protein n=1 Tax=Heterodera trifolii TaxID=157864 RepID=A0ABD2J4Y6_9BILA
MGQTGIEWEKNGVTPGAEGEEDIKKATKDDDGRGERMICVLLLMGHIRPKRKMWAEWEKTWHIFVPFVNADQHKGN